MNVVKAEPSADDNFDNEFQKLASFGFEEWRRLPWPIGQLQRRWPRAFKGSAG